MGSSNSYDIDFNKIEDIHDFEKSAGYAAIVSDTLSFSRGIGPFIKGKKVDVKGNVESIQIHGLNIVYIEVVYSIESDVLYRDQRHLFCARGSIAEKIRKEVNVGTGIHFIAQYNGNATSLGHNNGIEIIELKEINSDLYFPYYYCSDCKELYGLRIFNSYPDKNDRYCPVCGTEIEAIYKLYNKFEQYQILPESN